jgi:hypothetical protein
MNSIAELTLTLFKTGIFLVDDVQFALAAHDLTINAAFFDGCSYFHTSLFNLLLLSIDLIYT